ncbi:MULTISPECIES: helix-turn-helix domain-containing protein [unclassified Curtobacterium]|uniref:ArsR/SmtB family transcription factor n=1 Tax=unclassified Curtobacterium TaxID=257496 RepID=UPI001052F42B|nr:MULTISPECIES: helix-turn-helix domain-containing protein [unclassified Curtobacterium]
MSAAERNAISPDVAALRALSHPTRLRILAHLRIEGPATATTLATRFGINTGATSYHLRHLAHHGFVAEDSSLGNGRDRWWRASRTKTNTRGRREDLDAELTVTDGYWQALAALHNERMQASINDRGLLPPAWRSASTISDWSFRLPPQRAEQAIEAVFAVLAALEDNEEDTEAETVIFQFQAFPINAHLEFP